MIELPTIAEVIQVAPAIGLTLLVAAIGYYAHRVPSRDHLQDLREQLRQRRHHRDDD